MPKKLLLLFTVLFISLNTIAQVQLPDSIQLKNGDLLFENLDCGPLCDAIEEVTKGFEDHRFSHIGLVYLQNDSVYVIEAIGSKVQMTPINRFTARTKNKVFIGRLKPKYERLNDKAIAFALKQLDTPYDDEFIYHNGKYYCSELIYDAYKHANHGRAFFRLEPMTFKQPGSYAYYPAWLDYYRNLKVSIPEGALGINPGGISRSSKIYILNP